MLYLVLFWLRQPLNSPLKTSFEKGNFCKCQALMVDINGQVSTKKRVLTFFKKQKQSKTSRSCTTLYNFPVLCVKMKKCNFIAVGVCVER
jgi:hypothetical protein